MTVPLAAGVPGLRLELVPLHAASAAKAMEKKMTFGGMVRNLFIRYSS
jgi:hypothetical protein